MVRKGGTRERVYEYVRKRILEGTPPTVREVQRELGFRAVQSAQEHLDALVASGRLEKVGRVSRGYRLPGSIGTASFVPLLGSVQAGELSEAIENLDAYVAVDHDFGDRRGFALRVRGDSMIDAGILPGDIVIVCEQPHAENGEVVVALVDDEATVKRLRIRDGRVELHPENRSYPVIVPADPLRILGRVVEVRRYLESDIRPV